MYLGYDRKPTQLHAGESVAAESASLTLLRYLRFTMRSHGRDSASGRSGPGISARLRHCQRGKAAQDGLPWNLLVRLRFIKIGQEYLVAIPFWLEKFLLKVAVVSRLSGVDRRIEHYWKH